MHCHEPTSVYSELWERISRDRINPKKAAANLNEFFSRSRCSSSALILVIDEIDVLITRNQEVIYNLLDWPNIPSSNMVVVAIANTADLPERMLKNRISSRLGPCHIEFKPYTYKQLIRIATSRMNNVKVFEDKAIEYCSRKVASLSGDARKLLGLFRKAIELYENCVISEASSAQPSLRRIGIDWIDTALKGSYKSNSMRHLCSLSIYQKILLAAYTNLRSELNSSAPTLDSLIDEYHRISNLYPSMAFGIQCVSDLVSSLVEKRVLIFETKSLTDLRSTLTSNFPIQDILQALKSDPNEFLFPLVRSVEISNVAE